MDFADVSLVTLRVFREVAERGTLTSAAAALGYTQSAVSRQVASLERAAGAPLLERRHDGVRPTTAGHVMLRHAVIVLDQIDTAAREFAGLPADAGTVRLGWFTSAGATLLPRALAALRRTHPAITVITREGSTPRWSARCGPDAWTWRCSPRRRRSAHPTRRRPRSTFRCSPNAACAWRSPPPTRSPVRAQPTSQTCAVSAGSPALPPQTRH
jgi:DNA-binding transcriptional LysR family regulator